MGKKKRSVGELNASSMADIAFLLLVFFLVTTSMSTDKGLARRLPPPVPKDKIDDTEIEMNKRNVLQILVNSNNDLMVNGEVLEVSKLKEKAKEFILNPSNSEELPEKEVGSFGSFGNVMYTKKHVISLQNDRGTQYQAYLDVQNALVAAYDEIRDDFSMQKRGKKFAELSEEEQKEVQKIFPQKISEAEPKNYGGN
ncbi:MAG: biopolymer transporter ExbD [Paludibacteraceae bacterium]|jgi:biopolymer transport protein ExbD|nr:biopolymer transporter ExbD [Paludibacteraceae bacterium]